MASINEKLTRVNENISNLKTKLKLDKNAQIEDIEKALDPEIGFKASDFDSNGYAKTLDIYGYPSIEKGYLSFSGTSNHLNNVELVNLHNVANIGYRAFDGMSKLKKINLPKNEITISGGECFTNTKITQFSIKEIKNPGGASAYSGIPCNCSTLVAIWIGWKWDGKTRHPFMCMSSDNLKKIFIDLPRATVETIEGYYVNQWKDLWKFMGTPNCSNVSVICNDDEDWMTQEEFDAIDWATYTE